MADSQENLELFKQNLLHLMYEKELVVRSIRFNSVFSMGFEFNCHQYVIVKSD